MRLEPGEAVDNERSIEDPENGLGAARGGCGKSKTVMASWRIRKPRLIWEEMHL